MNPMFGLDIEICEWIDWILSHRTVFDSDGLAGKHAWMGAKPLMSADEINP